MREVPSTKGDEYSNGCRSDMEAELLKAAGGTGEAALLKPSNWISPRGSVDGRG